MSEMKFRLLFGVFWLVFFIVRIHYQRKVPQGRVYTRVQVVREKRLFRAFAFGYLAIILYAITPWLDAGHFELSPPIRLASTILLALGIAFFGWSHAALGANWTAILALSPEHQLVTWGPYRYIRHPIYSAFIVIGIGFSLVAANWFVAVLYLGTMLPMYFLRVASEEQMLLDRFGETYRNYMAGTGRLLPLLWR